MKLTHRHLTEAQKAFLDELPIEVLRSYIGLRDISKRKKVGLRVRTCGHLEYVSDCLVCHKSEIRKKSRERVARSESA